MSRSIRCIAKLAAVGAAALLFIAPRSDTPSLRARIYVPNQMGASISILDGRGRLLETVDLQALGFSAHAMPHQVAAQHDGSAWYVTLAGDGYVLAFDRENRLVARTAVPEPGMVVLDARRDLVYVSRALASANPPRSLTVLRASDLTLLEEVAILIPRPHALAVDTVSGRAYTGSLSTNDIAAIDYAAGTVMVTSIDGPAQAFVGLAVSPDGSTVAATTQLTSRLLAFTADPAGRLALETSVDVETLPYDVAYSPDGAHVWFPNQRAGTVTRVDTDSWRVSAVIRDPAFEEPHGIVLSRDGRTVYVSSHGRPSGSDAHDAGGHDMTSARADGSLAVIDAASGVVRSVTQVGPYAAALGLAELPN